MTVERRVLTVPEVAKQLGISRPTAYELANRADFPTIRLGGKSGRIVVPIEAFEQWIRRATKQQP